MPPAIVKSTAYMPAHIISCGGNTAELLEAAAGAVDVVIVHSPGTDFFVHPRDEGTRRRRYANPIFHRKGATRWRPIFRRRL